MQIPTTNATRRNWSNRAPTVGAVGTGMVVWRSPIDHIGVRVDDPQHVRERADPGSCVCRESNADAVLIFATQAGQPAVPLLSAWDLNSFSWIQRGTVQDMMAFMAKVGRAAHADGCRAHLADAAPVDPGEQLYRACARAPCGRRHQRCVGVGQRVPRARGVLAPEQAPRGVYHQGAQGDVAVAGQLDRAQRQRAGEGRGPLALQRLSPGPGLLVALPGPPPGGYHLACAAGTRRYQDRAGTFPP